MGDNMVPYHELFAKFCVLIKIVLGQMETLRLWGFDLASIMKKV